MTEKRSNFIPGDVTQLGETLPILSGGDRTVSPPQRPSSDNVGGTFGPIELILIQDHLRREEAEEQDVPTPEAGLTSSVGALWPPEIASFNRIKGIYTPGVIQDEAGIQAILKAIAKGKEAFRRGGITRISLRAIIDADFLRRRASNDPWIDSLVEAQIPLRGTQPVFQDSSLVYFGVNHRSRQPIPGEIRRYLSDLTDTLRYDQGPPEQSLSRVREGGYSIGILSGPPSDEVIDQVSLLYERFGWSRQEVIEILNKEDSVIAAASIDGQIVSAGIVEMAEIPIGEDKLRVAEITEAATNGEHAEKGLYTAVSTLLLIELADRSRRGEIFGGEIDLVYGECNGNAPGVLRTARKQGRLFAYEESGTGILFQHAPIAGLPKLTMYNDLFPTYLTRDALYTYVQ